MTGQPQEFKVCLFARAREVVGAESVTLHLTGSASITTLREALVEQNPELQPMADNLLFAINQDYAANDTAISPDSEIACFPPVSGG